MADEKPVKQPGKFRRAMRWSFGTFLNVKGWVGYDSIKESSQDLYQDAKGYFSVEQEGKKESFEQACERLGLDEKQLRGKANDFLRLAIIFGCVSFAIVLYAVYLAISGAFHAFVIAFVVALITLAYAFRFHFWWFQIKQRKLGCTLREWLDAGKVRKS